MHGKSWFSKYFFSYLTIGIIPILLGIVFYYTSIPALEGEIERSHMAALDQAGKDIDYITGEMRNIALHFSGLYESLPDNQVITIKETDFSTDALFNQQIKYYEEALNFPVTLALYFRGEAWLYTSNGKTPYSDFETDLRAEGNLTMSRFFTRISSTRTVTSLRFSQAPLVQNPVNTGMAYLYPLPYQDIMPRATLCFIYDSSSIKEIMENYLGDLRGDIYLFNEMLVPLFNYNMISLPADFSRTLSSVRGVGVQGRRISGNQYILSRSVSGNTGLSLVYVMQEREFFSRIQNIKLIIFFSVVFLELMVILFAIAMSRRNYRPIRSLLNNIGGQGLKNESFVEGNEFDLILSRVNTIEETNQELNYALDRQRPMVAYSCLRSLLSGEYNTIDEMDYYLKYADIDLYNPWFFVLIIRPSSLTKPSNDKTAMSSRIRMIQTVIEANNFEQCRLYSLELIPEQQVAVIVNSAQRWFGGEDIRLFLIRLLDEKSKANFDMDLKICSGRIYDNPEKIQASYLEAKTIMADYIFKPNNILLFEEMLNHGTSGFNFPVIEQSLYIQSVKQANIAAALKAVDDMIDKAAEAGPLTQCLCFDIINTMIKVSGELKNIITLNSLKDFTNFQDLEQFRLMARSITEEICRKSMELGSEKTSRLKLSIINYVNENFCSVQFSLQEVADHFGLGPTYLSRFFRQETGNTFIDYVSMLRLDKVKEYLVTTDKQIKEIVLDVGYMDTASFVRKFRAKEGITPGQYRERMKDLA